MFQTHQKHPKNTSLHQSLPHPHSFTFHTRPFPANASIFATSLSHHFTATAPLLSHVYDLYQVSFVICIAGQQNKATIMWVKAIPKMKLNRIQNIKLFLKKEVFITCNCLPLPLPIPSCSVLAPSLVDVGVSGKSLSTGQKRWVPTICPGPLVSVQQIVRDFFQFLGKNVLLNSELRPGKLCVAYCTLQHSVPEVVIIIF